MSGFRMPELAKLGPLEEKEAKEGDEGSPMMVPLNKIVAVGATVEFM